MPFDTRGVSEKSKIVKEFTISVDVSKESTCNFFSGDFVEVDVIKLTAVFCFEGGEHAQFSRIYRDEYGYDFRTLVDDIVGIYILATNKPDGKFYFSNTDSSKIQIVKQGDWHASWGVVLHWKYEGSNEYGYITVEQEPIGYLLNQSDLMALGEKLYKRSANNK
ncbi:MAG: hypothetical protein WC449_01940 [Candidatus Paceibacterota bacterium]